MNLVSRRIAQLYYFSTAVIGKKDNDIFLVSFPKSGNTWVRFYLCNLINNIPENHFTDFAVDFKILDKIMPELGKNNLIESWPFRGFPRIIKTHIPYNCFFRDKKAVLVTRDPRDVMVSYYKFETTKIKPRFEGDTISQFIRHPKMGIEGWCKHFLSWNNRAGFIIKYEDLKAKDEEIFARLNDFMEVKVSQEVFLKTVEQSRFENIKKVESTKGLADPSKVEPEFKFMRSGKTGQWKEIFNEDDLIYIDQTLQHYSIRLYDSI